MKSRFALRCQLTDDDAELNAEDVKNTTSEEQPLDIDENGAGTKGGLPSGRRIAGPGLNRASQCHLPGFQPLDMGAGIR